MIQTAPAPYPYMTWRQLQKHYPESWVLLLNADVLPVGYTVKGGQFVYSDQNQNNVFSRAKTLPKGSRMDIVYTGKRDLPENILLCL